MSVNISGNTLSASGFTTNSEIIDPNIVTNGLLLWYDPGNLYSYNGMSTYYDCGYGCQYYSSDPGCTHCDTQIKDMSGNAYDGTLASGASVVYDNTGGNASFNGTGNVINANHNLGTLSAYTICFWANRNSENKMTITSYSGTAFYWYGDNSFRYTHGGSGDEYYYSKSQTIGTGVWGFFCVTYDGTSLKIFRNGVYEGTDATTTTGTADFTAGLKIGNWNSSAGYEFNGYLGPIMMYNRALTSSEIIQNYDSVRPRYYPTVIPSSSATPTQTSTQTPTQTSTPTQTPTPSQTATPPNTPTPTPTTMTPFDYELEACWNFEEPGSSPYLYDYTVYNHDIDRASFTDLQQPGKVDTYCLRTYHRNDCVVTCMSDANKDRFNLENLTISVWTKFSGTTGGGLVSRLTYRNTSGSQQGGGYFLAAQTDGYITFRTYTAAGVMIYIVSQRGQPLMMVHGIMWL
jgi:hypothetical protein